LRGTFLQGSFFASQRFAAAKHFFLTASPKKKAADPKVGGFFL